MKHLIRAYLIQLFILWVTPFVFRGGFSVTNDLKVYLLAAALFTFLHMVVHPILKVLLLPLSLATFGLIAWLIYGVLLYVSTLFISQLKVSPWHFDGFSFNGFTIPALSFSFILTLVIIGFFMGLVKTFLEWLME